MFKTIMEPRFSETDALGHVNNTVLPVWFEVGRNPIFRIFNPDLNIEAWNLIIAKIEVSYLKQIFYGKPVEIRTFIKSIGTSSLEIVQEAWQNNEMCAFGNAVSIHFDYSLGKSIPMPQPIKDELEKHLR